MSEPFLANKTVLVTGASGGLGEHFCAFLKSHGARVIGLARRNLSGNKNIDSAITADVTDADSVNAAISHTFGTPGTKEKLYAVINNAGVAATAALHETSVEDEHRVVATNLSGVVNITRALTPHLKAAGGGVIVNVASVLGLRPLKHVAIYSATKAAVIQMTRSCALELAKDNIRVNAIAPGYVRTDLNAELLDGKAGEILKKKIPLGRFADLAELDAPMRCLLDPANGYMTGSVLVVDGGMSAGL